MMHDVQMPLGQYRHCTLAAQAFFTTTLCTTLLIMSMTFDRFYSIMRPHKAASFNTVKRAKITIACIFIFSILYNVPHLFISDHQEWKCLPYGKAMKTTIGLFYYWLSFVIQFALPFISLLIMNSVIIHTLRNRSILKKEGPGKNSEGQGESKGQGQKIKHLDNQVYVILLLVTFGFLILTTPAYLFFLVYMVVNYMGSPKAFAIYYTFGSFAEKLQFTNHGINFFSVCDFG